MDRVLLGSETAKGGFANERAICEKFNNWIDDNEAKEWLSIMGYDTDKLNSVEAIQIPNRISKSDLEKYKISEEEYSHYFKYQKADAQISIMIKIGKIVKMEYISLKKANRKADFNQIDKRSVDSYQEMWNFDEETAFWLKLFTGENIPEEFKLQIGKMNQRDDRRLFMNEMPENIQKKIVNFFTDNRILIIGDIIKGRGGLSAGWMLVTRENDDDLTTDWILKDINTVMNFYGKGEVCITRRGSLKIGKVTLQRKGGTPDPTKMQFKFKPCQLFELENNNGN